MTPNAPATRPPLDWRDIERAPCPVPRLSDLIERALADLGAIATDAAVRYDPGHWYDRPQAAGEPCTVCLAGAVLIRHYDVARQAPGPRHVLRPAQWMYALDRIRKGDVRSAVTLFYNSVRPPSSSYRRDRLPDDMNAPDWHEDPAHFTRRLAGYAATLRSMDL